MKQSPTLLKRRTCKHFKVQQVPDEELGTSYLCSRCGKVMPREQVPAYSQISSLYSHALV